MRVLIIITVIVFSINSCTTQCESLEWKSEKFNKEFKLLFNEKNYVFNKLGSIMDSLIHLPVSQGLKTNYVGYTIKPVNYTDGGLNKQDVQISNYLNEINCDELLINYDYSIDSIPLVLIRPSNLDKFNSQSSCPWFSVDLIYSPKPRSFINSPNWMFYKLNEFWTIRTGLSSL